MKKKLISNTMTAFLSAVTGHLLRFYARAA
jgi:hypothetical protein